ncbi:hypothetical protein GALL_434080 [mine drainage metagenome]|uniref:Uncharacterized protein n=1 Tax=mine drainage metagenome TaxID=410659 RepID=A0A1J5PTJ0_9ZZZZ
MDTQLGFDLEAVRQHRKGFDKSPREYPVPGKNILEGLTENRRQKAGQKSISGTVTWSIGGRSLIDAEAHHHVQTI